MVWLRLLTILFLLFCRLTGGRANGHSGTLRPVPTP
jgi:hypothetical protein